MRELENRNKRFDSNLLIQMQNKIFDTIFSADGLECLNEVNFFFFFSQYKTKTNDMKRKRSIKHNCVQCTLYGSTHELNKQNEMKKK